MLTTPFALHQAGGNRRIVENTETTALVRISMVGSTRQIGSNALAPKQCRPSRHDGGSSGSPGPCHHFWGPRKANFTLRLVA